MYIMSPIILLLIFDWSLNGPHCPALDTPDNFVKDSRLGGGGGEMFSKKNSVR